MSLNTILATTPLVSTGYHLKATGTTIGNSLIWDNGTNVGIGNTNTTYKLDVSGSVNSSTYFLSQATANVGFALNSAGANVGQINNVNSTTWSLGFGGLSSIGTSVLSWNTSGNVGIGASPLAKFFVNIATNQNIRFSQEGSQACISVVNDLANAFGVLKLDGSTLLLNSQTGGNVGIGTSSPSNPFTLNASASSPQFNITRSEQTNQGFSIKAGGGETIFDSYEGTNSVYGAYVFNSTKGSTTTERMRITSGGDVYIGTTSTINSNSSVFQMAFDNNARTGMALKGTASGSFVAIYFYNSAGTLQGSISSNGTGTTFYNTNSSDIRLKKNFEDWNENVSNKFFQLEPKLFNYLNDEDGADKTKGYIANDAVKDFPEAYPLGQDGYYSFNPSGMVVYLMKAIQEQQIQIQNLQEQINILAK